MHNSAGGHVAEQTLMHVAIVFDRLDNLYELRMPHDG